MRHVVLYCAAARRRPNSPPSFLSASVQPGFLSCYAVAIARTRALHCTALHCTALHCTALHCTALHCSALHRDSGRHPTLGLGVSVSRQCTALHCTALHCTALHCTALHCTALHCTAQYWCIHVLRCGAFDYSVQ
jgi:hypothetical protein